MRHAASVVTRSATQDGGSSSPLVKGRRFEVNGLARHSEFEAIGAGWTVRARSDANGRLVVVPPDGAKGFSVKQLGAKAGQTLLMSVSDFAQPTAAAVVQLGDRVLRTVRASSDKAIPDAVQAWREPNRSLPAVLALRMPSSIRPEATVALRQPVLEINGLDAEKPYELQAGGRTIRALSDFGGTVRINAAMDSPIVLRGRSAGQSVKISIQDLGGESPRVVATAGSKAIKTIKARSPGALPETLQVWHGSSGHGAPKLAIRLPTRNHDTEPKPKDAASNAAKGVSVELNDLPRGARVRLRVHGLPDSDHVADPATGQIRFTLPDGHTEFTAETSGRGVRLHVDAANVGAKNPAVKVRINEVERELVRARPGAPAHLVQQWTGQTTAGAAAFALRMPANLTGAKRADRHGELQATHGPLEFEINGLNPEGIYLVQTASTSGELRANSKGTLTVDARTDHPITVKGLLGINDMQIQVGPLDAGLQVSTLLNGSPAELVRAVSQERLPTSVQVWRGRNESGQHKLAIRLPLGAVNQAALAKWADFRAQPGAVSGDRWVQPPRPGGLRSQDAILVVGDSISDQQYYASKELGETWASLLETKLRGAAGERRWVQLAALHGTTASGRDEPTVKRLGATSMQRLKAALAVNPDPDTVVIQLGANDWRLRSANRISPSAMSSGLVAMVDEVHRQSPKSRIIVLSQRPPTGYGSPSQAARDDFVSALNAVQARLDQLNADRPLQRTHELHSNFFEPILDKATGRIDARFSNGKDPIHPSAAGQARLLESLWPLLGEGRTKGRFDVSVRAPGDAAGMDLSDLAQAADNRNCHFLSTLASLLAMPGNRLRQQVREESNGGFTVRLFDAAGKPRSVLIDAQRLQRLDASRWWEHADQTAGTREVWTAALMLAYQDLWKKDPLQVGAPADAMVALTGQSTRETAFDQVDFGAITGKPVVVGTVSAWPSAALSGSIEARDEEGHPTTWQLERQHAYSLVAATGSAQDRWLKLWDPRTATTRSVRADALKPYVNSVVVGGGAGPITPTDYKAVAGDARFFAGVGARVAIAGKKWKQVKLPLLDLGKGELERQVKDHNFKVALRERGWGWPDLDWDNILILDPASPRGLTSGYTIRKVNRATAAQWKTYTETVPEKKQSFADFLKRRFSEGGDLRPALERQYREASPARPPGQPVAMPQFFVDAAIEHMLAQTALPRDASKIDSEFIVEGDIGVGFKGNSLTADKLGSAAGAALTLDTFMEHGLYSGEKRRTALRYGLTAGLDTGVKSPALKQVPSVGFDGYGAVSAAVHTTLRLFVPLPGFDGVGSRPEIDVRLRLANTSGLSAGNFEGSVNRVLQAVLDDDEALFVAERNKLLGGLGSADASVNLRLTWKGMVKRAMERVAPAAGATGASKLKRDLLLGLGKWFSDLTLTIGGGLQIAGNRGGTVRQEATAGVKHGVYGGAESPVGDAMFAMLRQALTSGSVPDAVPAWLGDVASVAITMEPVAKALAALQRGARDKEGRTRSAWGASSDLADSLMAAAVSGAGAVVADALRLGRLRLPRESETPTGYASHLATELPALLKRQVTAWMQDPKALANALLSESPQVVARVWEAIDGAKRTDPKAEALERALDAEPKLKRPSDLPGIQVLPAVPEGDSSSGGLVAALRRLGVPSLKAAELGRALAGNKDFVATAGAKRSQLLSLAADMIKHAPDVKGPGLLQAVDLAMAAIPAGIYLINGQVGKALEHLANELSMGAYQLVKDEVIRPVLNALGIIRKKALKFGPLDPVSVVMESLAAQEALNYKAGGNGTILVASRLVRGPEETMYSEQWFYENALLAALRSGALRASSNGELVADLRKLPAGGFAQYVENMRVMGFLKDVSSPIPSDESAQFYAAAFNAFSGNRTQWDTKSIEFLLTYAQAVENANLPAGFEDLNDPTAALSSAFANGLLKFDESNNLVMGVPDSQTGRDMLLVSLWLRSMDSSGRRANAEGLAKALNMANPGTTYSPGIVQPLVDAFDKDKDSWLDGDEFSALFNSGAFFEQKNLPFVVNDADRLEAAAGIGLRIPDRTPDSPLITPETAVSALASRSPRGPRYIVHKSEDGDGKLKWDLRTTP